MNKPLISIIVPVYNFEHHLYECLDSLKNQSEENIEIIIVDDCSTDNIKQYVSSYLKDCRFHFYRLPENKGPGGARNKGLSVAKGQYIGFCDSDDWVDLNFYEKACISLSKTNADIAMCSLVREYDTKSYGQVFKCKYDDLLVFDGNMAFQIMTYNYKTGISIIPACTNKIYRAEFIKKLNINFQENVYFQDTIFSVQTILNCAKIVCIPNVVYHHYRRKDSIIQSFNQKHIDDFKNFGLSIKQYFEQEKIYSKYVQNYYNLLTHFYGIIIREIFEFVHEDEERKKYMIDTFSALKSVIEPTEYLDYLTAEQLRKHLLPDLTDTTLY